MADTINLAKIKATIDAANSIGATIEYRTGAIAAWNRVMER